MAFPTSPTNGQQYTVNNLTYQYNSVTNSWGRVVVTAYNKSTTNSSPPASPNIGDIWYNTTNDTQYRWTYDGTNYYWVDFTGSAVGSTPTTQDTFSPFLLMGA
jgi:hypothetical protein